MNWLDWLIVGLAGVSVIGGFREGFIRMGVGFVALIVGFVGATWFYGVAADPFIPYVKSRALANCIGFLLIFLGVTAAGGLLAALIARVFKMVGLSFVDRVLGAGMGFVRAALVLVIVTMSVMAFAPKQLPAGVEGSMLAPYVISGSRVFVSAAPYELRQGFDATYDRVRSILRDLNPHQVKKMIVRQE